MTYRGANSSVSDLTTRSVINGSNMRPENSESILQNGVYQSSKSNDGSNMLQTDSNSHLRPESLVSNIQAGISQSNDSNVGYAHRVSNGQSRLENDTQQNKISTTWKSRLRTVKGKVRSDDSSVRNSKISAADRSLVLFGMSKEVTVEDVIDFTTSRDIEISSCVLLTKNENARSHTFKIDVNPSSYIKVMNSDLWPYGTGIRHFKHFRNFNRNEAISARHNENSGSTGNFYTNNG